MSKERYGVNPTFMGIYWVEDNINPYPRSLWYFTDKGNADASANYLNQMNDTIQDLVKENTELKEAIRTAYENERTDMGRNVLKQLIEAIR